MIQPPQYPYISKLTSWLLFKIISFTYFNIISEHSQFLEIGQPIYMQIF